MADLVLDWGALGAYGTVLTDTDELAGAPSATVDTGGVAVDITFDGLEVGSQAFTFNAPGYVADGETYDPQSWLKLFGEADGVAGPTSTTTLDFRSTDSALYTDQVQNVSFRLNDIDTDTVGDIDGSAGAFEDILSVTAYDAAGNEVPVTFTPAGSVNVTGNTLDGETTTGLTDADGSVLVEIAGPVAQIVINYANGGVSEQRVNVSDIEFSTVDVADANMDPDAVDDAFSTTLDTAVIVNPLSNDTDPDGDPLTVTTIGTATNGTATLDPTTGEVTYTPNAGFVGTDTVDYTITDGNGGTDTATITFTVTDPTDPNTPPVAVDDIATTTINEGVAISATANDTDADGDTLTVTSIGTVTNGFAEVDPGSGAVNFIPDTDFVGEATIEYTVSDGNGGTDTGLITVTVTDPTDPNTPPVAVDDSATTSLDTPVTVSLLANDTDADGDTLTVTGLSITSPLNGSVVLDDATGELTYTPNAGFIGTDTLFYTVDDGNGGTDTGTVTFTVTEPGDNPPVAADDAYSTPEDVNLVMTPLDNDTDPDGDPLTITAITQPTNGVAVFDERTGEVTYNPDAGFNGIDRIEYTITDGNGNTDTAVIEITVGTGNEAPTAVDDTASTPVDTPVVITPASNDTDPNGDPLTVTSITTPTNGTATLDPTTGEVTYTPNPGFEGTDTIEYTIDDGNGGTDTGTITVTVAENTPPVAVDDAVETAPGTPVTILPLVNDTDADGDPLTLTGVTTPANGTVTFDPTTGEVTYTPDAGFLGLETLEYTVSDGQGGTDTGTITVGVGINNPALGRIDTDVFPVDPALQPLDPLDGFDEDADPSDDLDSVVGTSGADVISTGDDADTILAGAGDDTVLPGIDDDLVDLAGGDDYLYDVQGADTITGGQGNDTIIAGTDTFSDYEGDDAAFLPGSFLNDTFGFTRDPNQEDGRDSVDGEGGNDYIETGDDRDTITGGAGNDTLIGGIDDDLIRGNNDDDSLIGGHGSDTIDGGQGNDYIDGSNIAALEQIDAIDVNTENDRDLLEGFLGNDTIFGGDDDDTLRGGSGEDVLDGGIDEDLIFGGDDNDTLIGGQGADTLNGGAGVDSISGGEGRDVIVVSSAAEGTGDVVDGGSEGFVDTPDVSDPANGDYDILDLTGAGVRDVDWRIVNTVTDSNGNGIDGTVEYLDGAGNVTGTMNFFEIEEVVPCFTPGTLIATPAGEKLVEDLEVGDRVITRDNGIQEIKWVGRKDLTGHDLARKPHLNPVLIRQGALGNNLPEHDMLVSPNHRVLVANDKTALYFEEREVLVAAKHLLGLDGVEEVETGSVSYIHIMFDQHEVVLSNGAWTESFQPGDYSLKGIGNAQRQEILELFPELAEAEGLKAYASARRSLKKHEAALLVR